MTCPSTLRSLAAPVWPRLALLSGKGCFSATTLNNIWLSMHPCTSAHMEKGQLAYGAVKSHQPAMCDPFACGTAKPSSRAVLTCQHILCSVNHSTENAPVPKKNRQTSSSSSKERPILSLTEHFSSFANRGSAVWWWRQGTYFGKKQALP